MNRSFTATHLSTAPFEDRLTAWSQLKLSALQSKDATRKTALKVAMRILLADMGTSLEYDLMARLQILEGVSGAFLPRPGPGPWSRNPRRGIIQAKKHFEEMGEDLDPRWFSLSRTGLIQNTLQLTKSLARQWGERGHFSAEDILQNALMGLSKNGEPLPKGPLFMQVGMFNMSLQRSILSGNTGPEESVSAVVAFLKQRISDQMRKMDRSTVQPGGDVEDENSAIDRLHTNRSPSSNGLSFTDFLLDLAETGSSLWRQVLDKMDQIATRPLEVAFVDYLRNLKNLPPVSSLTGMIEAAGQRAGVSAVGNNRVQIMKQFLPAVQSAISRIPEIQKAYAALEDRDLRMRLARARRAQALKPTA